MTLYDALIERDLDAAGAAARAFASEHSLDALWVSVARFAVLAYSPSQHGKRAVIACRVAHEFLDLDIVIECARYAAEARQPWSEPPLLDPPEPEDGDLRAIIDAGDRLAAERWLAAHLDDDLRPYAAGDALLMLDTVLALERVLGEKGRYALRRMVIHEMLAKPQQPSGTLDALMARVRETRGAVDAVADVFRATPTSGPPLRSELRVARPYRLARDFAQTLIAHHVARFLPEHHANALLDAVHDNLEHGESFAEWSFA